MITAERNSSSIARYELVPRGLAGMNTRVTSGGSSPTAADVSAAADPAGSFLVVYVPPSHDGNIR